MPEEKCYAGNDAYATILQRCSNQFMVTDCMQQFLSAGMYLCTTCRKECQNKTTMSLIQNIELIDNPK